MTEAPWGAVVLAAGASRRMGQPKQLLPVDGRPLLVRTAQAALASGLWPVVVVLGAHSEQIRPALARLPVLTVENPAWPEGMASSVRAGVATLGQFSRSVPGALLALCDQPAFGPPAVSALLAALGSSGRPIAAARYDGHLGAPALFRREIFPELSALTGEDGARKLLQREERVAAVDLPEFAVDLDTPSDYAAYRST